MSQQADFKIYKSIQQEKRLTEIYLGSIPFSWPFAVVEYKADCTEAIPLTPFDKAICGLLNIEEKLSFNEIGAVLGLNVTDNPEENQYRDIAEYEILVEALTTLTEEFEMIEKGDNYFSNCRLTKIGKEYIQKGSKFRTTENKTFKLYFDLLSNEHSKAKTVFRDLKSTKKLTFNTDIDFEDENYLKSFAESQIPEIFSIEKGNSFINTRIEKRTFNELQMSAGVFYDLQLESQRIVFFNEKSNTDYFVQKANADKKITKSIFDLFIQNQPLTEKKKSASQAQFEDQTIELQIDIDHLLYLNKTEEALEKVNQFYKQAYFFDFESFFLNLTKIIGDHATEIWFSLPEMDNEIIPCLIEAIKKLTHCKFFLDVKIPRSAAIIEDLIKFREYTDNLENVYFIPDLKDKEFFVLFVQEPEWAGFVIVDYVYKIDSVSYSKKIIQRISESTMNIADYRQLQEKFANDQIPILIEDCTKHITNSTFETNQKSVEDLMNVDKKLNYIYFWINKKEGLEKDPGSITERVIDTQIQESYASLQQLKNERIKIITDEHKKVMLERLNQITKSNSIDKFETVEAIDSLLKEIRTIEEECFPTYDQIKNEIHTIREKLAEAKIFLKDQKLTKQYIIDTNIFIDEPEIISKIETKHQIILSAKVIDELDTLKYKLKKENDKNNADKALKIINKKLGEQPNIRTAKANLKLLPPDFNFKSPDNYILSVAIMYKDKNPILLTSDNGLQAKAKVVGIPTLSLKEFVEAEKYKLFGKKITLPINKNTGKPIEIKELLRAYDSCVNTKTYKALMSNFKEALDRNITGFSHRDYGFSKFIDFCKAMSEIFEIETDAKGVHTIRIKN